MNFFEFVITFPCVLLLAGFGIYFSLKSRFIQLFGMNGINLWKDKDSLKAFATALGGTVGIGSITGIGFALSTGGVGSIFWMWISSFFAMGIKYAETYICVKYKNGKYGGAMYALKNMGYKKIALFFAFITLLASFGGGNSAQSGAMAEAFSGIGVSPLITAIVSALLLSSILFGGKDRIVKVNSVLVPLSTVLYVFGTLFILFKSHSEIPDSFRMIVCDAFGIKQLSGGVSAFAFARSLRVGTVRGVFSHEAGMGSSPIAHSSVENAIPEKQGLFAVAEIYVDTFLVGTLTALCLICNRSFSVSELFLQWFGKCGGGIFSVFMAVFAVSATLSWCYYSEGCLKFLFGDSKKSFGIYKIIAIASFSLGCVVPMSFSMGMSDILNCLMTYPNLFLLFIKRKEICNNGKKGEKALGVESCTRCQTAM